MFDHYSVSMLLYIHVDMFKSETEHRHGRSLAVGRGVASATAQTPLVGRKSAPTGWQANAASIGTDHRERYEHVSASHRERVKKSASRSICMPQYVCDSVTHSRGGDPRYRPVVSPRLLSLLSLSAANANRRHLRAYLTKRAGSMISLFTKPNREHRTAQVTRRRHLAQR
jgi:hypothetical protein